MKTYHLKTYYPLILILAYISGVTLLIEFRESDTSWMIHFMAGFFLVFSFFKFLDLPAFAKSYRKYDWVAKRWNAYGYLYPFLELVLAGLYIWGGDLKITHLITVILMLVSLVGVIQSMIKKDNVQCACLGAVINLPVSKVTLIEDLLMLGMAVVGHAF